MARLIIYYAHPGHRFSQVNARMFARAEAVEGVTIVDLYAEYPRHNINIEREQARLIEHDIMLFQFPLFWYSSPSLVKEWEDLVLEHGFAYGSDGTRLQGKTMMLAVSAAGPRDAYTPKGYQHHDLRTFLTPFEQTARLCKMSFVPPYVLYGSLKAADAGQIQPHIDGYARLIEALRDDRLDFAAAAERDVLHHDTLPVLAEV